MRKRWHVLSDLIGRYDLKEGAEIGVKSGRNLVETLKAHPGFLWHAVDPWTLTENYARWTSQMIRRHEQEFDAVLAKCPGRIAKIKAFSVEAAPMFVDGSLDLVFIDGDHSYEGVRADIDAWLPKVRKGGVIAGHDYDNTNKYGDAFKGVDRAVHETFGDLFSIDADHVWWVRV